MQNIAAGRYDQPGDRRDGRPHVVVKGVFGLMKIFFS